MNENPFSPKHPASPKYFVNRRRILERFEKQLAVCAQSVLPRPDNFAVVGQWGMGKSSVLQKLESICSAQKELNCFSALVQLTPESCMNLEKFGQRMRDEIERSFRTADISLLSKLKREVLPHWRLKTIELGIVSAEKRVQDRSIVTSLEDSLRELWRVLSENGIKVAVLMFDDFHYMAQHYATGLYDIRGIFQNLPKHGCNIMLVVTGAPYLFHMAREFAEPFTRFFDRVFLDPFDIEETGNFIRKPLSALNAHLVVEDAAVEEIYKASQGHPYFLSFIMKQVVDLLAEQGEINVELFHQAYPLIIENLSWEKFQDDIAQASEVELTVLKKMAILNNDIVTPSQLTIKNVRKYLKILVEKKGLVIKNKRGEYSLYHPMFKEYLRGID